MDPHLDPDRLAAFMDGSLGREDRRAAEAHAADCPRCLQLLAAMARTEPAAAPRGWRLPALVRWALPAAAVVAVGVWLNVDPAPRESTAPAAPARVSGAATPSPRVAEAPAATQAERAPSAKATSPADRDGRVGNRALADSQAGVTAPSAPEGPLARERREPKEGAVAAPQRVLEPVSPLPAPTVVHPSAPAAVTLGAPASIPDIKAETARFQTTESLGRSAAAPAAGFALAAPDGVHRWRVRGAEVERSVDGGATWSGQRVASAQVIAGHAPSATVAWLVGRGGTVLRTIDGERWERLPFPETVDLVRVFGRSESSAEVTTADGRVVLTSDGGQTWTPR